MIVIYGYEQNHFFATNILLILHLNVNTWMRITIT